MNENELKKKEEKKARAVRLAACVKALKGNRSMRQMSLDSGVATSYISGIIKGEKIPGLEVMKKLTHPSANPQNGIRIEDLLDAVGLIDENIPKSESIPLRKSDKEVGELEEFFETLKGWAEEDARPYEQIRIAICGKLLGKGVLLQQKEWSAPEIIYEPSMFQQPQKAFMLQIHNEEAVKEWRFYLFPTLNSQYDLSFLKDFFTQKILPNLLFLEPDRLRCVTLLVTNELQYEKLSRYQNKISYKGNISVVQMNFETQQFEREIFLSLYDENIAKGKLSLIEK